MSLVELRNKAKQESSQPTKGSLKALRPTKSMSSHGMEDPTIAGKEQQPSADELRTAQLMKEFEAMPWYKQAGVAADDLIRMAAKGASFNTLDQALGPEAEAATRDAALRAGVPGAAAEIGGMVVSPVTRAIGAGAQALRPVGSGLIKALTNLGITAGEGGALAATDAALNGRDVAEEAQTGAGLAAGAEATLKHAIPKSVGGLANILSKVPYGDMSDIFKIASKSSEGAKAIKDLQAGKAPTALLDAIDNTKIKLESKPVPNTDEIEEALVDVFGKTSTTSGHKALDPQDQVLVNKLFTKAFDTKVDATTFNRRFLDDLFSYLEETRVPVAAEKSAGGRHVKTVHDAVRKVGSQDPTFKKLMDYLDTKKTAYRVGKSTSTLAPNARAFDTARDVGLATAFLGGSAALTNPVLLAALPFMLSTASPKVVGTVARKAGSTKRNLKKLVPKGTGYGTLGLVPGEEN